MELEEYKVKVKIAETIIQDLRNSGSESLESLVNMLNTLKAKNIQTTIEIAKLKKLILLKEDENNDLTNDLVAYRVRKFII